jgi:hypothetical protein
MRKKLSMQSFIDNKNIHTNTEDFLHLLKAFPAEELYRIVVDGNLHAKENGWVGYEKREPGCLKAFFNAFLFILFK